MLTPAVKSLRVEGYTQIEDAKAIEDVLCLATLIAVMRLPHGSTVKDALNFYENAVNCDCEDCPFGKLCLACAINI